MRLGKRLHEDEDCVGSDAWYRKMQRETRRDRRVAEKFLAKMKYKLSLGTPGASEPRKEPRMSKKSLPPAQIPSAKSEDQPVTRKMLRLVLDELKSEIAALSMKIDARFDAQDARFKDLEARFTQIDSRFTLIDAQFEEMNTKLIRMSI